MSRLCEQRHVEPVEGRHRVDDRVLRRELEHHGDVTELQVGVDEHDRLGCTLGQDDGEVGGDDRLAGAALGREDGDDPTELAVALDDARDGRHRCGHDQARGHPGHGLGQLRGFDRCLQDVLHAGAQRPLEHVGRQLVGDHDGADVAAGGQELLDGGELRAPGERRAEDDDDRDRAESRRQIVDRRERRRSLPQLHGQAAPGRLVGIDHGHCHLSAPTAGGRTCARVRHVLTRLTGEGTRHDDGPPLGVGP